MITLIALNQAIYKMIGARMSSKLAYSWLGKLMMGDLNAEKIFTVRGGIKLKLTQKEAIDLGIFHLGAVHLFETFVIEKILSEGDVAIDVGTYKDGWHSLLSAKIVGKKGHVYSFEPHPVFFKQFLENIKLNGFDNITVEKLGISDKQGTAPFYSIVLASSLFRDTLSEVYQFPEKPDLSIKTTTLDNYAKKRGLKKIKFIKIDAGGAEMKVFTGAKNLLSSRSAPDIMVEISDNELKAGGSHREEVLSYLNSLGYEAFIFTPKGLRSYSHKGNQITPNLFFTKRKLSVIKR